MFKLILVAWIYVESGCMKKRLQRLVAEPCRNHEMLMLKTFPVPELSSRPHPHGTSYGLIWIDMGISYLRSVLMNPNWVWSKLWLPHPQHVRHYTLVVACCIKLPILRAGIQWSNRWVVIARGNAIITKKWHSYITISYTSTFLSYGIELFTHFSHFRYTVPPSDMFIYKFKAGLLNRLQILASNGFLGQDALEIGTQVHWWQCQSPRFGSRDRCRYSKNNGCMWSRATVDVSASFTSYLQVLFAQNCIQNKFPDIFHVFSVYRQIMRDLLQQKWLVVLWICRHLIIDGISLQECWL